MTDKIQQDNYPKHTTTESTIAAVEAMVGRKIAKHLVEAFPGTQIYVPKKLSADHPLRCLGDFEAELIVENFSGESLSIPMNIYTPKQRYQAVVDAIKAGKPINKIALDTGCCRRRVQQIKAQALLANDNKLEKLPSLLDWFDD